MAERPSRRFYLADLVAAVLICGTVAAMFSSGRVFAESPGYSFIIIFVIINWVRSAPGRRPRPATSAAGGLPHPGSRPP